MNALDDIRIRTESLTVTDAEAVAVIEWCREWLEDCGPGTFAGLDGEYYPADTLSIPALLRGCDKHIEGGLSFVLSDVRRMANDSRQGIDRNCPACAQGTAWDGETSHSNGCPDSPEVAECQDRSSDCRKPGCVHTDNLTASERAIERAENRGMQDGRAAGSWFFDGNTSEETYRVVLKGIEDGDPAVMDSFPSSPLSGEWAGDLTPAQLFEDLDMSGEEDYADDVLRAFEDAFSSAAHDEIERVARYQTEEDEETPEIEECAECGHLHFDASNLDYIPCPVDECGCQGQPPAKVVSIGDIVSVDGNLYRFEFRTSADPLGVGVRGGDRYILRLL